MMTLITSCGRQDLLAQTVSSLYINQSQPIDIVIHEDRPGLEEKEMALAGARIIHTNGLGQHGSIERFLKAVDGLKYYLHCEDDWKFTNRYDWIRVSKKIMDEDQRVIKVLARDGSPHPCDHGFAIRYGDLPHEFIRYGYLQPWDGDDGIKWGGFSWNPGVTRFDLLKKFLPFPKLEQELAQNINNAGYKVVELAVPIYQHIGDGRSTHD